MDKPIVKMSEDEVKREYPISGLVAGWYFRQVEISNGGWEVSGTDLWGRQVSKQGSDPDILLQECVKFAQQINASVQDK